ncbi:MAG: hypothetical protein HUU38_04555 [Anaerolineales bacterium]|nr:hypothetical protein [Anaerolineales bacterium]
MLSATIQKKVFLLYGLLGASQSALGLYFLGRIPSAGSLLFGLSLERLILMGSLAALTGLFILLSLGTWQNWPLTERLRQGWQTQLQKTSLWGGWVTGSVLLLISGSFFTLITPEITEPFAAAYFLRLQPLARLLAGLAGQTLLALPLLREAQTRPQIPAEFRRVAGLYGLFLLAAGAIRVHLLRVGPDPVGWNTLGTPLLDTQVLGVFGVALLLLGLSIRLGPRTGSPPSDWKLDAAIFTLLWLAAAAYWFTIPLADNWYVSAPRHPAFSFYPNSDGVVYDTTAQSLLVGNGYQSSHLPFPRRPLYDLFLMGLYLLKGQDYEAVVTLQALLFGVFPALVYLMTKTMHTRLAGIIAGLLVLLREGNALALTSVITVSTSKMAMSDFPTAIGVVLLAWIAFRWLNAPEHPHRLNLILTAGGILAAAMQIRIETGVFIPIIFGFGLLRLPRLKIRYLTSLLAFVGCMALVLSPWVYRNWQKTGLLYLEVPDARLSFLLERLQKTTEDEAPQVPTPEGGAPEGGTQPAAPRQKTRPSAQPLQTASPSFLEILTNHTVHSLSQAILIFPDTYRLFDSTIGLLGHKDGAKFWTQCCSGRDYVKRLPFWQWGKWSGEIPPQAVVPILVNLLILAVGVRQTWKSARWSALLPSGMAFAYYLANGLARTSGGRYLLPVEWVWISYYSVGLAYLAAGIFRLFGKNPVSGLFPGLVHTSADVPPTQTPTPRAGWKIPLAIGMGFFILGVALPAAETLFPPRYTDASLQTWLGMVSQADEAQIFAPRLGEFFSHGGQVLQGRGQYLRYYGPDQGEPGSFYPAVYPRPFPRLSIFLVGPRGIGAYLPLAGRPDLRAENAADVLVFGCEQVIEKGPYFDALAMYFPATNELFLRTPFPETLTCPLPEP